MSEPENFLSRWSRRKLDAEQTDEPLAEAPREDVPVKSETDSARGGAADKAAEPEFDVSTLPPIESIGTGVDVRAFLQKGVPLELTRAALRRAWTTDPAIRDFIEVAENQWDFATGSDIPGFGPLRSTDDVRRLVADVFERTAETPPETADDKRAVVAQKQSDVPQESEQTELPRELLDDVQPQDVAPVDPSAPVVMVHREDILAASQQDSESSSSRVPVRRTHGGALPE